MPSLPPPQAGAISFEVLAELAHGATARVCLCRATGGKNDGRLLAVKRLHPHVADDPAFATEFLDEVWLTAALRHPNVVEVVGWGTDAGGSFLAVELVQGVSLARLMKTVHETGEEFTERMAVYLGLSICRGLSAAHALRGPDGEHLGLVHRDLTPGNVLVGFGGEVKIADFGLAKAKQRLTRTLTGLLKGQPAYMAPEQAKGLELDARADLFALGVLLFELFTGKRPWSAPSEYEVVRLMSSAPPADLRDLRPKIDKELAVIVAQLLEKSPGDRFASAAAVEERLSSWLANHGWATGNGEALARFVRRNAMRQIRWFERATSGELRGDGRAAPLLTSTPPALDAGRDGRDAARDPPPNEATDVEARRSSLASAPPAPSTSPPAPDSDRGEWSEEVPTLVQRREPPARAERPLPAPRAKSAVVPDRADAIPFDSIIDDGDVRTTAVKAQAHPKGVVASVPDDELPTERVKKATAPAVGRPPSESPLALAAFAPPPKATAPAASQPPAPALHAARASAPPPALEADPTVRDQVVPFDVPMRSEPWPPGLGPPSEPATLAEPASRRSRAAPDPAILQEVERLAGRENELEAARARLADAQSLVHDAVALAKRASKASADDARQLLEAARTLEAKALMLWPVAAPSPLGTAPAEPAAQAPSVISVSPKAPSPPMVSHPAGGLSALPTSAPPSPEDLTRVVPALPSHLGPPPAPPPPVPRAPAAPIVPTAHLAALAAAGLSLLAALAYFVFG
jgi:serine/threonine protein kinase